MTSVDLRGHRLVFEDHFDGRALDRDIWLPHYLPGWSSRAATAAAFTVDDSCLRLFIPPAHELWLPGEHAPALRVSGMQSGNFSGPLASTIGQQPWRAGATVREEQEEFWGWTPQHGYLEMRARGVLTQRSMFAWWLVGLENQPDRCAEICIAEVFGDAVEPGESAAVGVGLHAFRDPSVVEDFTAPRVAIDIADFHTFAVNWSTDRVDFYVDGDWMRTCTGPPGYPMQAMLAVFDFPDRSDGDDDDAVPELVIDYIRGYES